jgi:hypothetical protein
MMTSLCWDTRCNVVVVLVCGVKLRTLSALGSKPEDRQGSFVEKVEGQTVRRIESKESIQKYLTRASQRFQRRNGRLS